MFNQQKYSLEYSKRPEVRERVKQLQRTPKYKETKKLYVLSHKDERKKIEAKAREKSRYDVIGHYSNYKFECCHCGYANTLALVIDHIEGKGNEERIKLKRFGDKFYIWLRVNNYPMGYQVLCNNCNVLKERMK